MNSDNKNTMTVSYRNTFWDRLALTIYHYYRNHYYRNSIILLIGFGLFLSILFILSIPTFIGSPPPFVIRIVFALFTVTVWAIIFCVYITITSRRKNKPYFYDTTMTLDEETLVAVAQYDIDNYEREEHRWSMVEKLARTRRYIFIYLNQEKGVYVIPRRAFENSSQWETFYDICKQRTKPAS